MPLPVGPLLTYLELRNADGTLIDGQPITRTADNVPIFCRPLGSNLLLVVEGRPGSSGVPVGQTVFSDGAPDLQVEVDHALGNGSTDVCDNGPAPEPIGGVPAINPPSFDPTDRTVNALNDFGCRFDVHINNDDACTINESGNFQFGATNSTTQFCATISTNLAFHEGQTLVTARLLDRSGHVGNERKIIVIVPCPTE